MTPDTAGYYYAAYTIVVALYTGYAVSIWRRGRRARSRRP